MNFIVEVSKTANEKATEASYSLGYRIAQTGKTYTITETFIKSCMTDIVSCMLDEKSVKKINTIPFFNDTINNIPTHIKYDLISCLQCNNFSLKMNESANVIGLVV